MLKQHIVFKDFNEVERETDLYFNLTEEELVDMQADSEEGIQKEMMDAVASKDLRKLLDFIKGLVHRAYGERDRDGIHFNKSPEITARFINSAMYSPLLLSLFQDEGARTEAFITGLMPADLVQRAIAQSQGQGNQSRPTGITQPQDFLKTVVEAKGPNEAPPIGVSSNPRPFEANEEATPAPSVWNDNEVAEVDRVPAPQPAAPVQDVPQPFRVQEQEMDPLGNVITDPAEAEANAAFKRAREEGRA